MTLLESWILGFFLVYSDGEANQFNPPNLPLVYRRMESEEDCEEVGSRAVPYMDSFVLKSDEIDDWGFVCTKVQDKGTGV